MRRRLAIGGGSASILLVILAVCLCTFASLSLVVARLDARLAEKELAHEEAYYAADAKMQELLAEIDDRLAAGAVNSLGQYGKISGDRLTLDVRIDDDQRLEAIIELGPELKVVSYKAINSAGWDPAQGYHLWQS